MAYLVRENRVSKKGVVVQMVELFADVCKTPTKKCRFKACLLHKHNKIPMIEIQRVREVSEAVSAGKQPVSSIRSGVRKIRNVKLHRESWTLGNQ